MPAARVARSRSAQTLILEIETFSHYNLVFLLLYFIDKCFCLLPLARALDETKGCYEAVKSVMVVPITP